LIDNDANRNKILKINKKLAKLARRGAIPAGFLYLFLYLIADPSLSGLRVNPTVSTGETLDAVTLP
jgi:hypothetical protein